MNIFNIPLVLANGLEMESLLYNFKDNTILAITPIEDKNNKTSGNEFQICVKNYKQKGYSLNIGISRCQYLRWNTEKKEIYTDNNEDENESDFDFCLQEYQKEGYSRHIALARCEYLR